MRFVELPDGTRVSALGQGTWMMGDDYRRRAQEIHALQVGIDLGMTLIDTAEMYAEGRSEEVVGEAITSRRDEVFLVSKVYPHNAGRTRLAASCEASLTRLGTDRLDLYLLHWRGGIPLAETVEEMEKLRTAGKILRWGVSNLDTSDMKELWTVPEGTACTVNQVLYHLASRGIDYELLPWCAERRIPVMAYCPLAQAGRLRHGMLKSSALLSIAERHDATPLQIALAWTIRSSCVIAIPKASTEEHVRANAAAGIIVLDRDDLSLLDEDFPPPHRKTYLDIV